MARKLMPGIFVCLVVALMAVIYTEARAPPRPDWPKSFFVDHGEVVCIGGNGAPPCAGPIQGVIHAWYEFDEHGNFSNYREEAVLGNSTQSNGGFPVYNREYATSKGTKEIFLFNVNSTELTCVQFDMDMKFNRNFLKHAKYEGEKTVAGVKVHEFTTNWEVVGQPFPVRGWVRADDGTKIFGWGGTTVEYYYYHYTENDATPYGVFVPPPTLNCTTPPPPTTLGYKTSPLAATLVGWRRWVGGK